MMIRDLIALSEGEEVSMAPRETRLVVDWVYQLTLVLGRPPMCAEVGTWCGWTAIQMALAGARVVCVDPFTGSDEQTSGAAKQLGGMTLDRFVSNALMAGVGDRIVGVVGISVDVAKFFRDGTFDLVFLDGDHSEASVKADCLAWGPKVRVDGVLGGHDVNQTQVERAVRAACEEMGWPQPDCYPQAALWNVRRSK